MEKKTKKPSSYVYLIECVGSDFYKIGYAANPEQRLKELQIGCPYELNIANTFPGGLLEEKELHARYTNSAVRGEWFQINKDSLEVYKFMALEKWMPYVDYMIDEAFSRGSIEEIKSVYGFLCKVVSISQKVRFGLEGANDR